MQSKIEKLLGRFKSNNFLFTSAIETFYLSGAVFDGFWIVSVKNQTYIICSIMIENQVREYFDSIKSGVQIFVSKDSYIDVLTGILKRSQEESIIADSIYVNAETYLKINEKFKEKDLNLFVKAGILDESRKIKSQYEIEKIRKACQITSKTADIIKRELKAGISEIDIHYRILEIFAQNNVEPSFTPIVAAGQNSANPHHVSSKDKIKENDLILIDIGCKYDNYASDLTRTYYLNKINYKINAILDIARTAHQKIIENIKAGLPISWADKTARAVIDSFGYKNHFIHSTGHSLGIEIHESPLIHSEASGIFLNDMVVAIEPGIYFEGQFGVRVEDTILIKQNGCEVLTNAEY